MPLTKLQSNGIAQSAITTNAIADGAVTDAKLQNPPSNFATTGKAIAMSIVFG